MSHFMGYVCVDACVDVIANVRCHRVMTCRLYNKGNAAMALLLATDSLWTVRTLGEVRINMLIRL